MLGDKDGHLALGIAIGFMAALAIFIYFNFAAEHRYCGHEAYAICVRGWIGALSGWAAVIGGAGAVWAVFRQIRSAEEIAERQQRAVLGMVAARLKDLDGPNQRIDLEIKNWGATPAFDFRIRAVVVTGPAELALDNRAFGSAENIVGLTAPGETHEMPISFTFDSADKFLIKCGKSELFLHVFCDYEDAFRKGRTTQFVMTAKLQKKWADQDLRLEPGTMKAT